MSHLSEPIPARVAYRPTKATKAVVAGIVTIGMFLSAAFGDDAFDWGEVGEGISLLIGIVVGTGAVYGVTNAPK